MSSFICNTCNYVGRSAVELKEHYLSDWHRYNLKRKGAEMPPVSKENFDLRVAELKKAENLAKKVNSFKCPYSGKSFKSAGAWNTYSKSKKYAELVKRHAEESDGKVLKVIKPEIKDKTMIWQEGDSPQKRWMYKLWVQAGDDDDWEDEESDDEMEPIQEEPAQQTSSSKPKIEETENMEESDTESVDDEDIYDPEVEFGPSPVKLAPIEPLHDFFDATKTRKFDDVEEMLTTLEKRYGFVIPERKFVKDMEGLLAHISSKVGEAFTCTHCGKGFYSLDAVQKHMRETAGHARLNIEGDNALELESFYNFDELEENASVVDRMEVENLQLILPSGARIGHKEMHKYYKQKFDYVPAGLEFSQLALNRTKSKGRRAMIEHVLNRSLAIGWHQQEKQVKKHEISSVRKIHMIRNKWQSQLGIRHNKVLQEHFKHQMMNCG